LGLGHFALRVEREAHVPEKREGRDSAGDGDQAAAVAAGALPVRQYMLGDRIKDQLLQQILGGHLAPGSRIVETRVAREMGISQGPVREALRDLATLGLIDLLPYRGARVRLPDMTEIQEATWVRGELEALGAAVAASRVSEELLEEMRHLVDEMEDSATAGDAHLYVLKDVEFHRVIMRGSGNQTLERLWSLLEPLARTYLTVSKVHFPIDRSAEVHLRIIEALASGEPARAARAMRAHAEVVKRTLAEAYEKAWGPLDVEEGSVSGEGSLGG
jgi:DNA-binding GntR family transcriptional regulator